MIEDKIYYTELFDCYFELFTENAQNYFDSYFNEDMSLAEIAIRYDVSRAAVSKQLKSLKEQLIKFEDKLGLLSIYKKIDYILDHEQNLSKKEIIEIVKEFGGTTDV